MNEPTKSRDFHIWKDGGLEKFPVTLLFPDFPVPSIPHDELVFLIMKSPEWESILRSVLKNALDIGWFDQEIN